MSKEEAETRNPLPPPPPAMADREAGDGGKYPYQLRANPSFAYGHYGDRSDKMWTSWLVPMFLVANIVVFVVLMYVNNCPRDYGIYSFYSTGDSQCVAHFLGRFSFLPWKENPLLGPSSMGLLKMGAVERLRVVYDKQVWRLLSSIWLHAGLFHLIVNTLSLIFVGIRLEQQFGFVKVGVIYIVSGIGGSILSCFFLQYSVSAGASAPLFGLLGAMSSELITNCGIYANKAAAFFTLIALGAVNAALGILPRVGNFGNIGGFATGFLLGFVLLVRPQYGWVERRYHTPNTRVKAKYKAFQYVLWMVAMILLIAGFGVALVMLFKEKTNGNKHCSWCHYLTCVPTSKWYCRG